MLFQGRDILGSGYPQTRKMNASSPHYGRFAALVRPVICRYFNLFAENAALCMPAHSGK